MRQPFALCFALVASPLLADTALTPERAVTKLADGVYEIRHTDPLPGWVNGNTTVIIGTREVFVVDSCAFSDAAKEDIAQIRAWTDKPVRWLLNTHWHQDHNGGNRDYLEAFPGLAILAHAETKAMLDATSPHLGADRIKEMAGMEAQFRKALDSGIGGDGKPLDEARRKRGEETLKRIAALSEEMRHFLYQPPTVTFEDNLTLDLGGRTVQVRHLGRGNTGGDAVVYLPDEKILITGDLVVHPVPYTFDGYPRDWIVTFDRLAAFDATVIVPGHGEILRDKKYLLQLRDLMKSVVAQVETRVRQSSEATLENVKKEVDVKALRDEILAGDTADAGFFDYAIGSLIEIAFHEAKQR